jgi:MOSC domain-containing protein YiiM
VAQDASITVGNYAYTAADARNTVTELGALWREHRHATTVPDGWLAGARGFLAEAASLAGVPLPSLENVDSAFASLSASVNDRYDELVPAQVEALIAAMWRFLPTMRMLDREHSGTVAHLHASRGLPKKEVGSADIGWRGVEGDVQRSRKHHGRPWQALCIWSTDAIDTLRADGHPVEHGFAGENVTVSGIPNAAFRPGAHFVVGDVRGFLTSYAWPCSQNKAWFTGGDFMAMCHETTDLSRTYAMVTRTGTVTKGDPFVLFSDR